MQDTPSFWDAQGNPKWARYCIDLLACVGSQTGDGGGGGGGGRLLLDVDYIGKCDPKEYSFSAILVITGVN